VISRIVQAIRGIWQGGGTALTLVSSSTQGPARVFIDEQWVSHILGLDLRIDKDGKIAGTVEIQVDPMRGYVVDSRLFQKFPWLTVRCVPVGYDPPQAPYDLAKPYESEPEDPCCEIVDDRPCGRTATRYNRTSGVLFCDEHGGQNPRLPRVEET
jgi:hypothetical protein